MTLFDPSVIEEDEDTFHNDAAFMRPVMRLPAANGWRTTSVDAELESEDRFLDASRVKAIPVVLDDGDNPGVDSGIEIGCDRKVLVKLRLVTSCVPVVDVSRVTVHDEGAWGTADGFAVSFKEEDRFVNIGAVVDRDVMVSGFRAPDLGRHLDDEQARYGNG